MRKETIVVLGPTGNVGRPLLEELKRRGADVRAAARKKVEGTPTVAFDYGDAATYAAAFEGAGSLFLLTPGDPRTAEWTRQIVQAAKRAGVRRIVKLSAIGTREGARMTFGRWHAEGERAVRDSGLEWTFLHPNTFMQNFVNAYARTIVSQNAFYLPMGEAKVSYIDARDIAVVAAAVLTGEGHAGKTYTLTGPEALSGSECAEKLSKEIGRSIKYVSVSEDQARQAMKGAGLPDWLSAALLELYALNRSGEAAVVSEDAPRLTGRPSITFQRFASDFKSAFQA